MSHISRLTSHILYLRSRNPILFLVLVLILCQFHTPIFAQQKSTKKIDLRSLAAKKASPKIAGDSSLLLRKIPKKAALWSLIPGGGQVYNGQVWKAPIFAGGITGLSIFAFKRRSDYNRHYETYTQLLTNFDTPDLETKLIEARDNKRRALRDYNRYLNFAFLLYGINVLDAYANAHVINQNRKFSPLKAAYYSSLLPGLGQAYNKRYWKIPIVYGGFVVGGAFLNYNYTRRNRFRDEYLARNRPGYGETDPLLAFVSDDNLLRLKNAYNKDFTLSIILTSLWYVLNVVDALIDAHLRDFDVSDDLSFKVQPYFTPISSVQQQRSGGLNLSWQF